MVRSDIWRRRERQAVSALAAVSVADLVGQQGGAEVGKFSRAVHEYAEDRFAVARRECEVVMQVVERVPEVHRECPLPLLVEEAGKLRSRAVSYLNAGEFHARQDSRFARAPQAQGALLNEIFNDVSWSLGRQDIRMLAAVYALLVIAIVVLVQFAHGSFKRSGSGSLAKLHASPATSGWRSVTSVLPSGVLCTAAITRFSPKWQMTSPTTSERRPLRYSVVPSGTRP